MNYTTRIFLFLLFVIILLSCGEDERQIFDVSQIKVEWEVIENGVNGEDRSASAFTLINNGETPMPSSGWTLYFNQLPRNFFPESIKGNVNIDQISGDYFKLYPTEQFEPIPPGESRRITYETTLWTIKKSGAPAGLYFVVGGQDPVAVQDYSIASFLEEKQINRNKTDKFPIPTAEFRYAQNENMINESDGKTVEAQPIVPKPVSFQKLAGQVFIEKDWTIHYEKGLAGEAQHLAKALEPIMRTKLPTNESTSATTKSINLKTTSSPIGNANKEAYQLEVQDQITITGTDPAGVFYGIQSLLALVPTDQYGSSSNITITKAKIVDYPRFEYRGMFLDVARNFTEKEGVMKLLDVMAFYKLNKFHFHICDDEGWRLEIPDLPELTEVGSKRGHTLDEKTRLFPRYGSGPEESFPGSGFYTQEEFKEILKYATDRHIEVIPEVDMPGHARAAIKAMEARYEKYKAAGDMEKATKYLLTDFDDQSEYNSAQAYTDNVIAVCKESSYTFIEKIVDELMVMYKEVGAPLNVIHTGGDEVPQGVWEKSPICNELFANNDQVETASDLWDYYLLRFNKILSDRNLVTAGWEEVAMRTIERDDKRIHEPNPAFVKSNFMPYFWNSIFGWGNEDVGYQLANAGYKVVLCSASNLYFDLAYDKDPEETGLYWAGFVNTRSPYEFIPFDLFKAADMGRFGEMLDPDEVSIGRAKLTAAGRKNIVGIQAQLWSETIRNQDMMEYYIFPKLISLSERAWAQPPAWENIKDTEKRRAQLNKGWHQFATTIGQKEMPRLDHLAGGINYRIPPPGAKVANEKVFANTAFPGLVIRYTTDGSEPTAQSPIYDEPLDAGQQIKFKVFSPGGHSSRTVIVGQDEKIQ